MTMVECWLLVLPACNVRNKPQLMTQQTEYCQIIINHSEHLNYSEQSCHSILIKVKKILEFLQVEAFGGQKPGAENLETGSTAYTQLTYS